MDVFEEMLPFVFNLFLKAKKKQCVLVIEMSTKINNFYFKKVGMEMENLISFCLGVDFFWDGEKHTILH